MGETNDTYELHVFLHCGKKMEKPLLSSSSANFTRKPTVSSVQEVLFWKGSTKLFWKNSIGLEDAE